MLSTFFAKLFLHVPKVLIVGDKVFYKHAKYIIKKKCGLSPVELVHRKNINGLEHKIDGDTILVLYQNLNTPLNEELNNKIKNIVPFENMSVQIKDAIDYYKSFKANNSRDSLKQKKINDFITIYMDEVSLKAELFNDKLHMCGNVSDQELYYRLKEKLKEKYQLEKIFDHNVLYQSKNHSALISKGDGSTPLFTLCD